MGREQKGRARGAFSTSRPQAREMTLGTRLGHFPRVLNAKIPSRGKGNATPRDNFTLVTCR